MTDLFQERKNKIESFRENLVSVDYIKDKSHFNAVEIPDNVIRSCNACGQAIIEAEFKTNLYVCPHCGYHHPVKQLKRIAQIADDYDEFLPNLELKNFSFDGYEEKYKANQSYSGSKDAVGCYVAKIGHTKCAVAIMDSFFMMGSMGAVVGEKITSLIEYATKESIPLVIFCASGGARMQEGIISLMQMAKTSAAIKRHSDAGLLYISVLTHPTTGGVSASFATLADITIAEPRALIGFAGKRVIENTIKEKLPDEFQRSEFLLEKGFLDMIVERKDLKDTIKRIFKMHNL